ncbi:MAG TPA: twin-arginine translocation signal domain-containing protein [Chitinophagaceae bacterium]|nr:twin-arginine translocation signal domain-containing protein [Chitinophagaceae bacterium]
MANNETKTDRRRFLGTLASGAALVGLSSLPSVNLQAADNFVSDNIEDPELLFRNLKGKHRVVFDVTHPHPEALLPFAWPRIFLVTNEATGTPTKDNSVVVVLRHTAIPYAFEDKLWAKYNFGEVFKALDPATGKPSTRNPYYQPAKGTYKAPGVGEVQIGIDELQASGVKFVICNVAMTVYSTVLAEKMGMKPEEVLTEWKAGLLPGIVPVPSGVWAIGRAQENKCAYIFAG